MKYVKYIILSLFFVSCSDEEVDSAVIVEESISPDCQLFLEDYQAEIDNYISIQQQIELNGDDINLIIARNDAEQSISSMQTSPSLFQCCNSNILFKETIDSLNLLLD